MAKQLFSNNGSAFLAASISDADLTIQVANGYGALYPNPGDDEFFLVTIENEDGDIEIVKITSRASDLLTVPPGGRGWEGTSAQSWTNGQARVECRITAGTLEEFIQRAGDVMEGDLDLDDNELQNAQLTGTGTKILAGEIVNVPMRGVSGDSSNELAVPTDGGRATAGGAAILVSGDTENIRNTAFEIGMGMLWYGAAVDCPDGWAICDGTNGTPDMRGLVPIGAGGTLGLSVGDTNGAASVTPTASNAGGHDHGGATSAEEAAVPAHSHRLWVWESGSNGPGQMENFGNSGIGPAKGVAGNADSNTYAYRGATVDGHDLIEDASASGDPEHSHDITAVSDHSHTISAVATYQPAKAWHYIIYVGI